jgi:hypothetical protein
VCRELPRPARETALDVLPAVRHVDVVGGNHAANRDVQLSRPAHTDEDLEFWLELHVGIRHDRLCLMGPRARLGDDHKPVLADVVEKPALVNYSVPTLDRRQWGQVSYNGLQF